MLAGAALSSEGDADGSMGVDFGDYDHDGRLDIFVTNFADQEDNLYHNLGEKGFRRRELESGRREAQLSVREMGNRILRFRQ